METEQEEQITADILANRLEEQPQEPPFEQDLMNQLRLMTLHLDRIQRALEDVVHLLGRSQISPS